MLTPVEVQMDESWGLDHGTWSVPSMLNWTTGMSASGDTCLSTDQGPWSSPHDAYAGGSANGRIMGAGPWRWVGAEAGVPRRGLSCRPVEHRGHAAATNPLRDRQEASAAAR